MAYGYLGILEGGFDRMLLEAQQVVIQFKEYFGTETFDRFTRQKQRLAQPQNDISYWVRRYNEAKNTHTEQAIIDELETLLGSKESIRYDIEGKKIPAPAQTKSEVAQNEHYTVWYVDDVGDMIDLAMTKIDGFAGGYWCIAGRYELYPEEDYHKDIDRDDAVKVSQAMQYFPHYLDVAYSAYFVCMPKDGSHQKYCLCAYQPGKGNGAAFQVWDTEDQDYVGDNDLQDIPEFKFNDIEFKGYESVESHEYDDDVEEENDGPHEWTDENGVTHMGHEPAGPSRIEFINMPHPETLEYHVGTREEAIDQFRRAGVLNDVEFVEDIPGTPLCVLRFQVEPRVDRFPQEGDDVYERHIPGDRYTIFIFLPGDGGGPLLSQDGKLVAALSAADAKQPFVRDFHQDQVFHQNEEPRMRGRAAEEDDYDEPMEEGFWSYRYGTDLEEGCEVNESLKFSGETDSLNKLSGWQEHMSELKRRLEACGYSDVQFTDGLKIYPQRDSSEWYANTGELVRFKYGDLTVVVNCGDDFYFKYFDGEGYVTLSDARDLEYVGVYTDDMLSVYINDEIIDTDGDNLSDISIEVHREPFDKLRDPAVYSYDSLCESFWSISDVWEVLCDGESINIMADDYIAELKHNNQK